MTPQPLQIVWRQRGISLANNLRPDLKGTPDVASFIVFDRTGTRVAYGTGPVAMGDIEVSPAP